jgi:hypothetical protein
MRTEKRKKEKEETDARFREVERRLAGMQGTTTTTRETRVPDSSKKTLRRRSTAKFQ